MWFNNLFNIYTGDGKNATNKKLAKMKNSAEFQRVFADLLTTALDRYKINGLPESCSERVILQSLLWYGAVIFFIKDGELLALPGRATEDFNIYGNPKYGWVYGANGYNERIELYIPGSDDSNFLREGTNLKSTPQSYKGVYVRENAIEAPFINDVIRFSESIADTYRTLDVCRANIKQPYIVVAQESIVNSVKQFFNQRDDNVNYVVSSGVFPADKIQLLPFETNADNIKNCTDLIEWYNNQFQELCGFRSSTNPDKKERLIAAEENSNDDITQDHVDKCTKYIQQGLDICNEVFSDYLDEDLTVEANTFKDEEAGNYEQSDIFGISGKEPGLI